MKTGLFVFFTALILFSCNKISKKETKETKFKKTLQELLLAKGMVDFLKQKDSTINDSLLYAQYAKAVFIKYNTSPAAFEKNLNAMKSNSKKFEILLDSINNTLTQTRYKQVSPISVGNL